MSAWDEKKPILKRLPQYAWQDNEIVSWIVDPYDRMLVELQQAILNFPKDFIDPLTCRADALDWLAQLMGFTGDYWDTSWPEPVKRTLIKNAQFVWSFKGTQQLLEYLLALFSLDVAIELQGSWQVGETAIGSPIGGELLTYSLLVNSTGRAFYLRSSDQWRLVEQLNRLFMPCWCSPGSLNGSFVHYDRFRVGLSAVGEPI
jgi:phage tail P2-like protein